MLNVVLRNKIQYPEVRLLYDSKMRLSLGDFSKKVREQVKNVRSQYKVNTVDLLVEKAIKFKVVGSWYQSKIREFEALLFKDKKIPNAFVGQWRSIEFECLFNSAIDQDTFIKAIRAAKLSKHITIKNDSSIQRNENDGLATPREVVVNYRAGEEDIVGKICKLLRTHGHTNKSCGTHVHFDMRHVSREEVLKFGKRLALCVPALKTILPKSRRSNQYCVTAINTLDASSGSRYSFVNLHAYSKYKTIEVRGHSGTISAEKILNWIAICERIMATDNGNTKEINTIADLVALYSFDEKVSAYMKSRYEAFNKTAPIEEGEDPIRSSPPPSAPQTSAGIMDLSGVSTSNFSFITTGNIR